MKKTFRHSMTWLHTWTGLLLSWVLFAILITGTATYFRHEISRWMMPELAAAAGKADAKSAARKALGYLEANAGDQPNWSITLPNGRSPMCSVMSWGNGASKEAVLNPETGEALKTRETRGGDFFYRFHFELQLPYPWGRYLAGVAALFMFVALITGIVAHRQFFKEFFTFRPTRAWLRSCMDFHNVMAVLALPFYLVISFSALVIFMRMYLPWPGLIVEKQGEKNPAAAIVQVAGNTTTAAPFEKILDSLQSGTDSPKASRIFIRDRNKPEAGVQVMFSDAKRLGRSEIRKFSVVTGEEQPLTEPVPDGPVGRIYDVLYGVHLAHFANPLTRTAFFVMGLMGAAMTGSGMVMWTQKRKAAQLKQGKPSFGYQMVDRLNIAGITGFLMAIAVFFWANRLLPLALDQRETLEVKCFLYAWGVSLLHAWCRPVRKAWIEQLWINAVLFAGLPVVDWVMVSPWIKMSLSAGRWLFPIFDAVMVLIGAVFVWTALKFASQERRNRLVRS
ncbi:MAG: PepSY-associated TM helix domain-containing protein [Luteolibacter sp.]